MTERIEKPWGYEIIFAHTPSYVGKVLFIKKGRRLSLQYHKKKDETIYLFKGALELLLGGEIHFLAPGDSFHIPPQVNHRLTAREDCWVYEVSTPEIDDVVRLEDDYGRVATVSSSKNLL